VDCLSLHGGQPQCYVMESEKRTGSAARSSGRCSPSHHGIGHRKRPLKCKYGPKEQSNKITNISSNTCAQRDRHDVIANASMIITKVAPFSGVLPVKVLAMESAHAPTHGGNLYRHQIVQQIRPIHVCRLVRNSRCTSPRPAPRGSAWSSAGSV
jgi:hypothetical protein